MNETTEPETPRSTVADALAEVQQSNGARLQALAAQGAHINFLPLMVQMLMEHVLPDENERTAFLLKVEQKAAETMDEVEQQMRMARLSAPVAPGMPGIPGMSPPNGMRT